MYRGPTHGSKVIGFCKLFFIQGADESALVDPSNERWIDDEIRVGLFCLRVMSGNHVERTGNHLHGRCRHRFQSRDGVLVGVLEKLLARAPHVFPPDSETRLFVAFKNRNGLDESLQNSLDHLWILRNRRSEGGYSMLRIGQSEGVIVDQLEKSLALSQEARRDRQRSCVDNAPF